MIDMNKLKEEKIRFIQELYEHSNENIIWFENDKYYKKTVNDNLFVPLNEYDEKSFSSGDGKELEGKYPKMASLRSSSALAYNYFYSSKCREFEYKVKILKDKMASDGTLNEVYSNIDVYEITEDSLIYNEVKFLELFDYKENQSYIVQKAYLMSERYLLKNNEDIILFNEAFKHEFKLYNFPQILKMILASLIEYELRTPYNMKHGKEIIIRNLVYEVNDLKYKEMTKIQKLYNDEVEKAKEIIDNLLIKLSYKQLKISFQYITFQEAFAQRKKEKYYLSEDYLEDRYFFRRINYFHSINIKEDISFKTLVYSAFEKKFGSNYNSDLLDRINLEFDFIVKNEIENDFIFLYKLVNKIKEDNQLYLLNNNINASVISYILGISHVNPHSINKDKDFRYIPVDFFKNNYKRIFSLRLDSKYINHLKEWIERESFTQVLIIHGLGKNNVFIKNESDEFISLKHEDRHTKLKNEYACLELLSYDFGQVGMNSIDFDNLDYQINAKDLCNFGKYPITKLMQEYNGKNNDEYAKVFGIMWSMKYITTSLVELALKNNEITIFDLPAYQEDLFLYLINKGIENKKAFEISSNFNGLVKENVNILKKHNVDDYLIHAIENGYLVKKTAFIDRIVLNIKLCELNKNTLIHN